MAFDERLAERIRGSLGKRKGLIEKKMFGGVAFLLNGNMCVGVTNLTSSCGWPRKRQTVLSRSRTRGGSISPGAQ